MPFFKKLSVMLKSQAGPSLRPKGHPRLMMTHGTCQKAENSLRRRVPKIDEKSSESCPKIDLALAVLTVLENLELVVSSCCKVGN
jgi:hypothetical protein